MEIDGTIYSDTCFNVNPEKLYDEGRSFIVEADLKVEINFEENGDIENSVSFVKEMKSIFND